METEFTGWFKVPFYTLETKAPYKDKATNKAEPMAKPLPIAAVVFPAASN